jgi:sialate O-acetylesterase
MKLALALLAAVLSASVAHADDARPTLASVFTDHMVLQRDRAVPVWGEARPGDEVTVEFAGQKKTGRADAEGKWTVNLDPLAASAEPRELKAGGLVISDVLVGDVWLCSGQSNMGMPVVQCADAEREIAAANHPDIRFFIVGQTPSLAVAKAVEGRWQRCSPQTVGGLSGAGYFFGRHLHQELKIPIGLLHSAVGGTPAEAWTRIEPLRSSPTFAERAAQELAQIRSQEEDQRRFVGDRLAWEQKYNVTPPPMSEAARGWADPALDTASWKTVTLPALWSQLGVATGGVFWLRKDVTLPGSAAGKPFVLDVNRIEEQYDTTFFNGVEIGRNSDEAPDFYNVKRVYRVPGELVKAGRNVIAVRVVSATPRAGVWQVGYALGLPVANPASIDNTWQMQTESSFAPLPAEALASRPKPNNIPLRRVSAALYNGMIAPLMPCAIKGAIWYQGEANASRYKEYEELLSLLIRDWRAQWKQGDFPFIIQQLVNNGPVVKDPATTGNWPFLREAQARVAAALPNCGIAIGIELGSDVTIHPPNKQDVGRRLALVALEKVYGKPIESSGPRFASMTIEGSAVRVKFTHAEGLTAKDGAPRQFSIAGDDDTYSWADAKIENDTIVVSSPQVAKPVAVRYAWADNPAGCNLSNAAGLPMAPFRSDGLPTPPAPARQLSKEQAWEWYRSQPWIVGWNFVPSTAGNTTEMWSQETFDAATIDKELGMAAALGCNSCRVFVSYTVWKNDPEGLKKRLGQFLALAGKHGLSTTPVLFDDCSGTPLPNWTPSPGLATVTDKAAWPDLEKYVKDIVGAFATDKRR